MNRSAQNKVLIVLSILFVLCILGLGYWYFFVKKDGISISIVSNDWGDYNELYEYKTKESKKITERSFNVNIYIKDVQPKDSNECVLVDAIVYNMNISDNLEKEISICNYIGDIFEIGYNYDVEFSRDVSDIINISGNKILMDEKRNEYLFRIFEIIRNGFGGKGLENSEMLLEGEEETSELEGTDENVQYKRDVLELLAAKKLLEEDWLSEGQREEIQNFIDENMEYFSLENSYLPCYAAKELGLEYTSILESPDGTNNIVNDGDMSNLIGSLYLEGSLPPEYNDSLRLFADDIKYCSSMSSDKYLRLYGASINYLYNFHNINEETVFWLNGIRRNLNLEGSEVRISNYTYNDYNAKFCFLSNMCSSYEEYNLNNFFPFVKREFDTWRSVFNDSVAIVILSIITE